MSMREATRVAYSTFLQSLLTLTAPFDVVQKVREAKIDVKMGVWLKKHGYVIEKVDNNNLCITAFSANSIDEIVSRFGEYREALKRNTEADRRDLEYYRNNKEFLIDTRTQKSALSDAERIKIIQETTAKVTTEVAEYAAMAVRLGKTDVAGFITTMLTTK